MEIAYLVHRGRLFLVTLEQFVAIPAMLLEGSALIFNRGEALKLAAAQRATFN